MTEIFLSDIRFIFHFLFSYISKTDVASFSRRNQDNTCVYVVWINDQPRVQSILKVFLKCRSVDLDGILGMIQIT